MRRAALVGFLCFHVFAISVASLHKQDPHSLTRALRTVFLPLVRPYLLATGTWQQWNLFAPDPLRTAWELRIVGKSTERKDRELLALAPSTLSPFRRAKGLKLLRSLAVDDHLLEIFLRAQCRLSGETLQEVTLTLSSTSLPTTEDLKAKGGWKEFHREWQTRNLGPIRCITL